MKGDFTRVTFDSEKHYTEVLKQQGRVSLDADWNEQANILSYLNKRKVQDIIGLSGVPKNNGGFKIELAYDDQNLTISPGRIYVDGLLCELEPPGLSYFSQPDFPNPPAINSKDGRTDLIYLDVWQRHITAIEDPKIKEVALGGPDTCTRVKTVWQVKLLQNIGDNRRVDRIKGWPPTPGTGLLSTSISPIKETDDPCIDTHMGGYRGLENRLYRVEIHEGGELGTATFKWSRENGSTVFPIIEFIEDAPKRIRISKLNVSQLLNLQKGNWVEVLGDETELKGLPGTIALVEDVDEQDLLITLNKDVSAYAKETHPKVRLWDQGSQAIPITINPVELEDGVAIQFSDGSFQTGDYWTFTARTNTKTIDLLKEAPSQGIQHHYCKLALVTWKGNESADIYDCRNEFLPLTELPLDRLEYLITLLENRKKSKVCWLSRLMNRHRNE